MITTFTLNAAIDKCYRVNGFKINKANRVKEFTAVPGGKGINVAKVAHTLGAQVIASGFLGGTNGQFIENGLKEMKIESDFVWTQGNSRETISIIDNDNETATEFLEIGPVLGEVDLIRITEKVVELSQKSKVVTFSGSIPQGMPIDIYANLIQNAKKNGAITILDTSGEALSKGLEGIPNICKPNTEELEQLLGYRPQTLMEIKEAVTPLIEKGIRMVIVSMDSEGSLVVTPDGVWKVTPPTIKVENTVGCGDSLVSAIAYYMDKYSFPIDSENIEHALRLSTAVSASNAMNWSAGSIRLQDVEQLLDKVSIQRIDN